MRGKKEDEVVDDDVLRVGQAGLLCWFWLVLVLAGCAHHQPTCIQVQLPIPRFIPTTTNV